MPFGLKNSCTYQVTILIVQRCLTRLFLYNINWKDFKHSYFICIFITPWHLTTMLDDSHCEATLMKLYSCWEMILLHKKMNVQRPVSCVHWWTIICRLWCQSRFEICDNSWGLHCSPLLWQQWTMQSHSTFCTPEFSLRSHIWRAFMNTGSINKD